jgi:hypothetical protein
MDDATDTSEALTRLGFETIVGLDLEKVGKEENSIAFSHAAREIRRLLVAYGMKDPPLIPVEVLVRPLS